MKFKVLDGKHQAVSQDPSKVFDIYRRGDVVETDADLCKLFNSRKALKFLRVPEDTPVRQTKLTPPPEVEDNPVEVQEAKDDLDSTGEETALEESEVQDSFTGLTVKELRSLAEENEIDLGEATRKDDILKVMRKHVGG